MPKKEPTPIYSFYIRWATKSFNYRPMPELAIIEHDVPDKDNKIRVKYFAVEQIIKSVSPAKFHPAIQKHKIKVAPIYDTEKYSKELNKLKLVENNNILYIHTKWEPIPYCAAISGAITPISDLLMLAIAIDTITKFYQNKVSILLPSFCLAVHNDILDAWQGHRWKDERTILKMCRDLQFDELNQNYRHYGEDMLNKIMKVFELADGSVSPALAKQVIEETKF